MGIPGTRGVVPFWRARVPRGNLGPAPVKRPRTPSDDESRLPLEGMLLLDPAHGRLRPARRRVLVGAAVLALGAAGVAVLLTRPSPEVRAARFREQAWTALAERRFAEAETYARESLVAGLGRSDLADGRALLGEVLGAAGRDDEAAAEFEAAVRLDPDHVEANGAVARRALRDGDAERAERHLERALRGGGTRPDLRFLRADVRLSRGDLGGALEDLRAGLAAPAVDDSPAKALLAAHLAEFLARTTDDPAFLDDADAALRRVPSFRETLRAPPDPRLLAEWHLASGRPRSALQALAAELSTTAVVALRAEAHRLGDEAEQAEIVLREALSREASPVLHAALVRLLLAEGRARSAGVEAAEAARLHPDDLSVAEALRALAAEGAAARAPDDLLLAALRASPAAYDPVEPLFVQRILASPRGVPSLAAAVQVRGSGWLAGTAADGPTVASLERDVKALLELAPDHPLGLAWRGAIELRRGDVREALASLDRAVAAAKRPGRERAARAAALAAAGRWADAAEDARALVRAGNGSSAAAVLEARSLLALGEPDAALSVSRRALSRWPDDVAVLAALRDALAATAEAGSAAARGELRLVDLRLAAARLDPEAARRALTEVADAGDPDPAVRGLGAQIWDDVAAEWAARERASPGDPSAPLARAASLFRAGRRRQAEAVLRDATRRFDDSRLHVARARVLTTLGGFVEAEMVLRATAARDARPEVALEIGRVLVAAGRRDEGAVALREVLSVPGPVAVQAAAALDLLVDDGAVPADADAVERWLRTLPPGALGADERDLLAGHLALVRGEDDRVVPVSADASAPVRARSALLVARSRLRTGDASGAEEVLATALAADPGHVQVRTLLAHVRLVLGADAFAAGDLAAASRHFERAVTGSELDVLAAAVLADVHLRLRDLPAAAEASRRLTLARRGSPAAPMFRGYVEVGRGREAGGLAEFAEALLRAPSHPAVLAAYVDAITRAGRPEDAERACRRAVDEGDRLGFATFLLGRLLARRGDDAEAEAVLRRALARDPGNFGALTTLADVLRRTGRADEARNLVVATRPEDLPEPPPASRFERLRLYVETGGVLGAADRLREILSGAPDPSAAEIALGSALLACGEAGRALERIEAALRADPDSFAAAALLVRAYSDLGRLDEAERRLDERTTAAPGDAGAWCLRGMLESHRGRRADAVASYRRALAVAPRSALAANNLSCLLFEDEATRGEALDLVARLSRELPGEPRLAATHAWLLTRAGRADGALSVLDDAIPLHPSDALLRLHRAEALRVLGREDAAAAEVRAAERLDPGVARRAGAELRALAERTR